MFNLKESVKSISENEKLKDKVKEVVKEQVNKQIEFAKSTVRWYVHIYAVIVLVGLILAPTLYNIIF